MFSSTEEPNTFAPVPAICLKELTTALLFSAKVFEDIAALPNSVVNLVTFFTVSSVMTPFLSISSIKSVKAFGCWVSVDNSVSELVILSIASFCSSGSSIDKALV